MGVFVYAVAYQTPPTPGDTRWAGVQMVWVAPDGSRWSLTGDRTKGVRMQPGVRGLTMPEGTHQTTQTAGLPGAVWNGWSADVREVFWPLWVWCDESSAAFLEFDAEFWRTLDPRDSGVWEVTHPNGTVRSLTCRFVDDGKPAWDWAPGMKAWAKYGVTLSAEDPFWRGAQVVRSWAQDEGEDFFGGAAGSGFGPPFFISSGQTLASAQVDNAGDEPASVTWWVEDALTSAVGVGGQQVTVPFEVATGRLLVLDGSPEQLTAVEVDAPPVDLVVPAGSSLDEARAVWVAEHLAAGTDRTIELGDAEWAQIPRRATTTLSLEATGSAAKITARFTPQYHRAW